MSNPYLAYPNFTREQVVALGEWEDGVQVFYLNTDMRGRVLVGGYLFDELEDQHTQRVMVTYGKDESLDFMRFKIGTLADQLFKPDRIGWVSQPISQLVPILNKQEPAPPPRRSPFGRR